MCEECKALTPQSFTLTYNNLEIDQHVYADFSTDCYCKYCKKYTWHIDLEKNIAKVVRLLQLHGFNTAHSCQGHDKFSNACNQRIATAPYIAFYGNEILKYRMPLLRIEWVSEDYTANYEFDFDTAIRYRGEESEEAFEEACSKLYKLLMELLIDHEKED